jgi:hypothetical protein
MQTSDTNNQLTDTGHCLSPITVSGTFLMLAQNGNLLTVCEMIQERGRIAEQIQHVEQQLLSCNHPYALAPLGLWHESRNRNVGTELIELAEKLETRKCELRVALQQIDEQLAQKNLGFDWTVMLGFVSLIPTSAKPLDPVVALRHMIIDQNIGKPHSEICKILDFPWRDGEPPERFFPDGWKEKYGVETFVGAYEHPDCRNLVQKMISSRRPKGP